MFSGYWTDDMPDMKAFNHWYHDDSGKFEKMNKYHDILNDMHLGDEKIKEKAKKDYVGFIEDFKPIMQDLEKELKL